MKTILISAALLFGSAAMAQDAPPPTDQNPPVETMPPATDPMAPPPADAAPPPAETGTPMPAPDQGAKQFGTPPSVDQKYPAPPAKAEYPWCSKTVKDGCKQRRSPK